MMDEESGRRSKRNQVGQGVELAAEGAFAAAHPSYPAIEHIENQG